MLLKKFVVLPALLACSAFVSAETIIIKIEKNEAGDKVEFISNSAQADAQALTSYYGRVLNRLEIQNELTMSKVECEQGDIASLSSSASKSHCYSSQL